ncbi:MAG: S8 family peptidase [Endozoicomonas sp.]
MKTRIVLLLALTAIMDNSWAEANNDPLILNSTDQIIVRYHPKPTEGNAIAFIKHGATYGGFGVAAGKIRDVLEIGAHLDIDDVTSLSKGLEDDPQVAYAEPDLIMQTLRVPNDTRYNEQWHYFEPTAGINMPEAWDITTGHPAVVAAVIDTGMTDHQDIKANLVPGYDFISNAWSANDGDGWDNNPSDMGDSIQPGDCGASGGILIPMNANPSSWHGVHVMGTIGAISNNGLDVAGVSWQSRVMPLRALGRCGGYLSDIVSAMEHAAGSRKGRLRKVPKSPHIVSVVNMSLGGEALGCPRSYQDAIDLLVANNITVVVAAGNERRHVAFSTPANCRNVIVVGAINRRANLSLYSNFGHQVDISAPGGETQLQGNGILSLSNSGLTSQGINTLSYYQGTSMAAPHVTGVIALSYAINPEISPQRREALLKKTARPFPGGSTCYKSRCGAGIIDAVAFLRAVQREP